MGTLKGKSVDLIVKLRGTNVPDIRSMEILIYAQAARNDKQITLYEEYLLAAEAFAFERQSYMQSAWNRKVYILNLVPLLNMKMMAMVFQEEGSAKMWESWGMEAYKKNQEKRAHYILDKYPAFLHAEDNPELLRELPRVRKSEKRSFKKGPYHDECFPYSLCCYEELLLGGKLFSQDEKIISSEIEDVLVEISMIQDE